jgi:hypothetical protein
MYAIRTEVIAVPGKTRAWETWWAQFSSMAKAQQGFQSRTLLNSLSYLAKYVFLLRWENRDARQAWTKGGASMALLTGTLLRESPWIRDAYPLNWSTPRGVMLPCSGGRLLRSEPWDDIRVDSPLEFLCI